MTIEEYRSTLIVANLDEAQAFIQAMKIIVEMERHRLKFEQAMEDSMHEQDMQGWMNDLDQDDQAIEGFCDECF